MDAINVEKWQEKNPHKFVAMRLDLNGRVLRLTSGGTAIFNATDHNGGMEVQTFLPSDSECGTFAYIGEIEDGESDEALSPDVGFEPFTAAGFTELVAGQGSQLTVYKGLIDVPTGAVIGQPGELFYARLNVAAPEFGAGVRQLLMSTYTEEQYQLLFEGAEMIEDPVIARTMSAADRDIFWRGNGPSSPFSGGGGGSGPGTGTNVNIQRV